MSDIPRIDVIRFEWSINYVVKTRNLFVSAEPNFGIIPYLLNPKFEILKRYIIYIQYRLTEEMEKLETVIDEDNPNQSPLEYKKRIPIQY
jgi:hypothetical protein